MVRTSSFHDEKMGSSPVGGKSTNYDNSKTNNIVFARNLSVNNDFNAITFYKLFGDG
jgi:hypothetical protein